MHLDLFPEFTNVKNDPLLEAVMAGNAVLFEGDDGEQNAESAEIPAPPDPQDADTEEQDGASAEPPAEADGQPDESVKEPQQDQTQEPAEPQETPDDIQSQTTENRTPAEPKSMSADDAFKKLVNSPDANKIMQTMRSYFQKQQTQPSKQQILTFAVKLVAKWRSDKKLPINSENIIKVATDLLSNAQKNVVAKNKQAQMFANQSQVAQQQKAQEPADEQK